MSIPFDHIRQFVLDAQQDQGPVMALMREVLIRYEGDYVIPMPHLENEPTLPSMTPALIGEAVDSIAMRAASVSPSMICPPLDLSKLRGRRSRQYGLTRERILAGTYTKSRWPLAVRRLLRQLAAYNTGAMVVVPDMVAGRPRIEVRDALSTYPEPKAHESLRDPQYVAFINRYSSKHLRERYPVSRAESGGPITNHPGGLNKLWDVVEWYDADEVVWGILGPVERYGVHVSLDHTLTTTAGVELVRLPNRAGIVPCVAPHSVSLGRIASRMASMIGNVDLQSKMMALNIAAQEKAVFPDTYIIGRMGMEPRLAAGQWQDGRSGDVNLITDADSVGVLRTTPDPATGMLIDRLERNFRTSTAFVPQFGGETYGAMRTGRAIDSLAGIALDPRVQELHEILEAYLPNVNEAVFRTYKGYWGSKSFSFYTGRKNDRVLVEFVPNEHIETTENTVSYVVPGADVVQLTQVLGSLMGANIISRTSAREGHPYVASAAAEENEVRAEQLIDAVMQGIQQQIMAGTMPPIVATMLKRRLDKGEDVLEAIEAVQEELQRKQATVAQAPAPDSGLVAPPTAMPGMAGGPGMAQEQMPPGQVEVPPDAARMRQLLQVMGG